MLKSFKSCVVYMCLLELSSLWLTFSDRVKKQTVLKRKPRNSAWATNRTEIVREKSTCTDKSLPELMWGFWKGDRWDVDVAPVMFSCYSSALGPVTNFISCPAILCIKLKLLSKPMWIPLKFKSFVPLWLDLIVMVRYFDSKIFESVRHYHIDTINSYDDIIVMMYTHSIVLPTVSWRGKVSIFWFSLCWFSVAVALQKPQATHNSSADLI